MPLVKYGRQESPQPPSKIRACTRSFLLGFWLISDHGQYTWTSTAQRSTAQHSITQQTIALLQQPMLCWRHGRPLRRRRSSNLPNRSHGRAHSISRTVENASYLDTVACDLSSVIVVRCEMTSSGSSKRRTLRGWNTTAEMEFKCPLKLFRRANLSTGGG